MAEHGQLDDIYSKANKKKLKSNINSIGDLTLFIFGNHFVVRFFEAWYFFNQTSEFPIIFEL